MSEMIKDKKGNLHIGTTKEFREQITLIALMISLRERWLGMVDNKLKQLQQQHKALLLEHKTLQRAYEEVCDLNVMLRTKLYIYKNPL